MTWPAIPVPPISSTITWICGSLIAAATAIGGMAAGASETSVDALDRFGGAIGLAFQVMDDVLDVTSTTSALGKTAGRDTELQKSTYPGTIGLSAARALADQLVDQGRTALRDAQLLTTDLERFAAWRTELAASWRAEGLSYTVARVSEPASRVVRRVAGGALGTGRAAAPDVRRETR